MAVGSRGKRRILGALLAAALPVLSSCGAGGVSPAQAGTTPTVTPVALPVTDAGNPITRTTGGDPAALVDGDTVYLYTGHDVSTHEEVEKAVYDIPEYLCYSSTDLRTWREEGVVLSMDAVSWAANDTSAWASQVAKHDGKYYLYYCTWDKSGKQSIGVAVADAPTGMFADIGEPLVRGSQTKPDLSSFNDIDPTVWIETDEAGEEHRYLAWGNGVFFVCELNEDMISVRDRNGDGVITCGLDADADDIVKRTAGLSDYTEAPWLYRRTDEGGAVTGDYYLFFAHEWRESMAYATTDDLFAGAWSETRRLMYPTATSNTNHPAVIDFKGKTYFIGHDGALPGGSGFRRSVTIQELVFLDDGTIDLMEETAAGLTGETSQLVTADGALSHETFVNSAADADYPYRDVAVGVGLGKSEGDALWVLRPGKAAPEDANVLSIESENKPGLYLTASAEGVFLAQDADGAEETAMRQTFRSYLLGEDGGVLLESVALPGQYLTIGEGGMLVLGSREEAAGAPFVVE